MTLRCLHPRFAVLLTLIFGLGLGLVLAPAVDARPQVDWEQPLNLSLAEAQLSQVLKSFAKIAGGTLVAEHPLDGTVSLDLVKTPFRGALDQICQDHALRCEWHEKTARLTVYPVSEGSFRGLVTERISIKLARASLEQTLAAFSTVTGGQVVADGSFDGSVTLELVNVAWTQALEMLCADAACAIDWDADPIRVSPGEGSDEVTVELKIPIADDELDRSGERARLKVRFTPDDGEPVETVHTFDWTAPVWRLAAGDRRLHMAWLPFDPPILLELMERCTTEDWPALSAPWTWSPDTPRQVAWPDGGSIDLLALPAGESEPSADADSVQPCVRQEADKELVVAVREHGQLRSETVLRDAPGSYLLIEPAGPSAPDAERAEHVAVVRLGHRMIDGVEEHRVILARPQNHGAPRLSEAPITHGKPHVEDFGAWSLELALRSR